MSLTLDMNRNFSFKPRTDATDDDEADDDESRQNFYSSDDSSSVYSSTSSSSNGSSSSSASNSSETFSIKGNKNNQPAFPQQQLQYISTTLGHQTSSSSSSRKYCFSKWRKFELFSTAQCYYLIASNKEGTAFRVLKMDRTLIEDQTPIDTMAGGNSTVSSMASPSSSSSSSPAYTSFPLLYAIPPPPPPPPLTSSHRTAVSDVVGSSGISTTATTTTTKIMNDHHHHHKRLSSSTTTLEDQHNLKPTLRPLVDFCFEDPVIYTAGEIQDMLDMIQDGNKYLKSNMPSPPQQQQSSSSSSPSTGGNSSYRPLELKPLVKACGIVGFIRFLDCYYLTLITSKSKVGTIAGNFIYTIKNTETIAIKPVERDGNGLGVLDDPSSMLLNMWNRGKRSLQLGLSNRELAELRYQQLFQVCLLCVFLLFQTKG